ncbi:hypothetical protein F5883DRAFT_592495 [Diaporthe sp. PMI_573]|nr:hypothetical protein F5883DRAFT_592495 [Diaporthaceae sp. PMI_573]
MISFATRAPLFRVSRYLGFLLLVRTSMMLSIFSRVARPDMSKTIQRLRTSKAVSPLQFCSSWRQSSTLKRGGVVAELLIWSVSLSHVGIPDPLFVGGTDLPSA